MIVNRSWGEAQHKPKKILRLPQSVESTGESFGLPPWG